MRRLRRLAYVALTRYKLQVQSVSLIRHVENTTFRVETLEGRFVLRIHRIDYNSPEQIDIELAWLQALSEETELVVPRPVPGNNGRFRQTVDIDGIPQARECVLFVWIEGRFRGARLSTDATLRVGQMIAELHHHAQTHIIDPLRLRPKIGAKEICGAKTPLNKVEDVPGITKIEFEVIQAARREIARRLAHCNEGLSWFGLTHGDLHGGNFLFYEDEVRVIDFDDCRHSFWMYDIATVLCYLNMSPEFERLRDSLYTGYTVRHDLKSEHIDVVNTLATAKRIAMLEWTLSHRHDSPKIEALIPLRIEMAVTECRSLLDEGKAFVRQWPKRYSWH